VSSRRRAAKVSGLLQWLKQAARVLAGDAQGGGSPLVGGAAASMLASAFCWRAACFRRGGNHPRPSLPLGETGKGDQIPCCRRLIRGAELGSTPLVVHSRGIGLLVGKNRNFLVSIQPITSGP
jgi:hypothetical protein